MDQDRTGQDYRYEAFISYRHVEPDRKWARWLHKSLETFKTPKPLVAKGVAPQIKRVFRDEDELPASADLSSEIDHALQQSRFLVVVCSPRTPESQWVNQEVVRFREMGRHDKILALLIEGEPAEAFPRALCEIRTEITDEHGEVHEQIEDVEPLAADVRTSRDESEEFLKRLALLRFSAAVLGCRFDDLRRREAERRKRRLIVGASMLALAAIALAGLSIFAFSEQARAGKQQERAEGEWARAESERDAKSAALDRVLRLADSKKVSDLLNEADTLWPLHPDKAAAMASWIERASALLKNRGDHRLAREGLREKALPYTEAQRLEDHAGTITRIEQLRVEQARVERVRATLENDKTEEGKQRHQELTRAIPRGQEDLRRMALIVTQQASWQFDSYQDAWRHEVLSDLLDDLAKIEATDGIGALADVRARHDFATTLQQRSIEDHRAEWDEAIAAIASSPRYAGLQIKPQMGLVPLGQDPYSGLFEFAHLGSGSLPARDDRTGSLAQQDDATIVLVLIPGGTRLLGAQLNEGDSNHDPEAQGDESPVYEVTLSPYFLSKYECTQAQWKSMTGGLDPSRYKAGGTAGEREHTPRNPVEQVSWEDSVGTSGWLVRNGLGLPSEAQWEFACRAGKDTPWFTGREVEDLSRVANIADSYLKGHGGSTFEVTPEVDDGHTVHAPVGSFAPNSFGLHDMHGNVREWCWDSYHSYRSGPKRDPLVEGTGDRAFRGGSWGYTARDARSSNRGGYTPTLRGFDIGVRPGRSVTR